MFTCLTYLERNVRVDCEFLASDMVPGPYCEYRQDSRLVGSTYPNAVIYVSTEDRRRSNVSLVAPNLCRLTWAPMADEKPYTYTCRVYQGNGWKENSMAIHHSEFFLLHPLFFSYPFEISKLTLFLYYRTSSDLFCNQCPIAISTLGFVTGNVTPCHCGSSKSMSLPFHMITTEWTFQDYCWLLDASTWEVFLFIFIHYFRRSRADVIQQKGEEEKKP